MSYMNIKEFFDLLKESVKDFFRQPRIVLPALCFLIFVFLASFAGKSFASFQSSWGNIIWTSAFFLIFIFVGALFLGVMISVAKEKNSSKENTLKGAFNEGARNWIANFLALFTFSVLYWIVIGILYVLTEIILSFQPAIVLSILQFKLVAFFVLFAFLAGVFIFFSFMNFYISIYSLNLADSVRKSFSLVRKEYLAVLSLSVLFFVLYWLTAKLPNYFAEVVEYLILLPFFVILMTRFVMRCEKNSKN